MIYILSGEIETGKTNALLQWIKNRSDVYGVLSPTDPDIGRYFLNAKSRTDFNMQTTITDKSAISVGRYHFLKSAFQRANDIIEDSINIMNSGYLIIDELGKLELNSEGLHKAVKTSINVANLNLELHLILVIRASLLEAMIEHYNIVNYIIIDKNQLSEIIK